MDTDALLEVFLAPSAPAMITESTKYSQEGLSDTANKDFSPTRI